MREEWCAEKMKAQGREYIFSFFFIYHTKHDIKLTSSLVRSREAEKTILM